MPAQKVQALAWHAAVESVVAPLVRALREQGMSNTEIFRLLEEVAHRVTSNGRNPTPSVEASPMLSYSAGTRLISRWRSDPVFSDDGIPRPLPLKGPRSFDALARGAKVNASAARAALRRLGLIRMTTGRVVLHTDAYVPSRGATEKLDILGRDGAEFIRTMLYNVKAPSGRGFLQRKTSYDNIGSESVPRVLAALRKQGGDVLWTADALLAKVDRDRTPSARGGRRTRVSFGIYCFTEPVPSRTGEKKKPTARRRVR
jgi:hypothetical protein